MYRFDELRPGEPAIKMTGKKRSFRDNISAAQGDKVNNINIIVNIFEYLYNYTYIHVSFV